MRHPLMRQPRILKLLLAVALPALSGCQIAVPASAATRLAITDAGSLQAALAAAKPGDRLRLQSGDYGNVLIQNMRFSGRPVLLVPAPGAEPRFTDLNISGSSGLAFAGITFSGSDNPMVNIGESDNVTIAASLFTGATRNADPWDDENRALSIRMSQKVRITDSRFTDIRFAIFVQRSSDVTLERNSFSLLREGLNFAANDNLRIAGNEFSLFRPNYTKKEHPDAVQFWTSGETRGSHCVEISGNRMDFPGEVPVQGIFIRSELAENGKIPDARHKDIRLLGNLYYGSARNAFALSSVDRARVSGNSVLGTDWAERNLGSTPKRDLPDGRGHGGLAPGIFLSNATDITADHNIAMLQFRPVPGVTATDNIDVMDTTQRKGVDWSTLFPPRGKGDTTPDVELLPIAGSDAQKRGIGVLKPLATGPRPGSPEALLRAALATGFHSCG